ncbi:hypothetical protein OJAV_G00109610 [Oryzias javanicus]|uniref:C2H2-type domain-containing protein n=1 Tax=Oryzias javanicus TaxID=123683 RepID=A0A437CUN8_ORYJA|nr:hypothetical protein OJAV_G00109610 [Oryzias javanicus]
METPDQSAVFDPAECRKFDLQVASRSPLKMANEETEVELQTSAASCVTSVGDGAAASLQKDCDGPGEAPQLPDHHLEEAPHLSQGQTPSEDDTGSSEKNKQKAFQLVLNELLQQQKHRPGRRFKKKTLVKMAKLLVVARGWDGEAGPPDPEQDAPEGENLLSDDIMETHNQNAAFDSSSVDKDEELEPGCGSDLVPDLQVASRTALKMEGEETEVELQTSAASCLTSVGDGAAASLQKDCDGPGEAPELPDHPLEEAPHPPQGQTPTEDDTGSSEKNKQKAFQLVLNELLQQQKHRPGRRFKKKTLMKMAKLLVITRGWDGEAGPPDPEQDAPVATGEDGSAETTAASVEQEDLNFSQEAHDTSRSSSTSDPQKCSSSLLFNREEAVRTQTNEEQNPGIFRVLESHRPRKRMKKASRTSRNKKAEQKPPEEAQSAFSSQTEEKVASAEQDEDVRGHAGTILTVPEVRDGKQLDGAVGKRRRRNKTKAAQTKPEAETLTSQELPQGGAVLQSRPKLRRCAADEAVPPPECLLRERSPAGNPEKIHAGKTRKSKKRKRPAALKFSAMESSPEKERSDEVWFGSFSVKQEEAEQPIQSIKKRRGRKRKEVNELQSSEPPANEMAAAAVTAEGGQPKAAVQGETKRRGRKKKIKLELPEKLSEDFSNMEAVEESQEEHLKTVEDERAPPRRKPRKKRGTSGTARRKVKPAQTFSNLVQTDLGETEEKTIQLSDPGEVAPPTINSAPEDQEDQMPSSEGESHLCSVCGRSFRHLSVLTIHRLMHDESKPPARPPRRKRSSGPPRLSCPCCAAAFSSKTQLLFHMSNAESCTTRLEAGGQLPPTVMPPPSQDNSPPEGGGGTPAPPAGEPSGVLQDSVSIESLRTLLLSHLYSASSPLVQLRPSRAGARYWLSSACDVCSQQPHQDKEPPQHCSVCCELSGEAETCKRLLEAGHVRVELLHLEEERTRGGLDGAPVPSPSPSSSSSAKQVEVSRLSPNPKSNQEAGPPFFRPQRIISRRFLSARWGRSFSHFSRRRLHGDLHRKPEKAFHCSRCELDFHFLDGAAAAGVENRSPAWRSCRSTSCCTEGSRPTSARAASCRSLRSADLTAHLNAHEARLRAPEPACVPEPLSFPYPCRKCDATFSSAEFLQAHQVCHFTAGKRPENPASYVIHRAPEDPQRGAPESSQPARPLPVSNRKYLFRYPHPDRLYVVPTPPSEPALLISDSEDEIGTSAEPGPSLEKPTTPQPAEVSEMDQLDLLIQSLIPEVDFSESNSCCVGKAPPLLTSPQEDAVHSCAMCTALFTELSELHAHYMAHARKL